MTRARSPRYLWGRPVSVHNKKKFLQFILLKVKSQNQNLKKSNISGF